MKFFAKFLLCMLGVSLAGSAAAQWSVPAGASFSLGGGSLNLACLPVTVGGTYDLANGHASGAGDLQILSGGVLNGQGLLQLGSGFDNQGSFNAGTGSVVMDGSCTPASNIYVSGQATFNNLTLSSTTGQTYTFQSGVDILVTGILTVQGQPGLPVKLLSASGTPIVIRLAPGAQVVQSNATLTQVHVGSIPIATTGIPTLNPTALMLLTLMVLLLVRRQRNAR